MSRHIAESRLNLVDHDKICLDSSWVPWVTGSCGAVRSGSNLTKAATYTKQTNSEMNHTIMTSNPVTKMKVSGETESIVPASGFKTNCSKSKICSEIFVEPRGTLLSDIKYSWCSAERLKEPKFGKSKGSAISNKITHDNRVDCRQTSRDAANKRVDKQNCTKITKKQSSKLSSLSELEQSWQSSSDCSSNASSFTVSCRSAANYFLKQQTLGPFNDGVNGEVHLNSPKYLYETERKTDIFSLSYPDNDSSQSGLKCNRSTSVSGESSCNGLIKRKDEGINNKNIRYGEKEIMLDKNSLRNPNCLQDTTHKLPSDHSYVNVKMFNKVRTGITCKGTGSTIGLVGEGVNSELLQDPVKRESFLRPHSQILSENETTVSRKNKSFLAEGGKSAYRIDHSESADALKTSDKEEEHRGVQMSRSVELGIDVLLFAISRFKNIIKRCSRKLPNEGIESEKEDVLERCVNELGSKLKTVHDNTTRLLVEVKDKSNLGNNIEAGRPTTSAKQELDYSAERGISDKQLQGPKSKVQSFSRPNTCFPSRASRQYSPDTSSMIRHTKGR